VGLVFEGSKRFDLKLFLPPAKQSIEGFGELLVGAPNGRLLPLGAVARVRETEGPAVIFREDMRRRVMVEVNVRGRDLVSFVHDAQIAAAKVPIPAGIEVSWGGQFENFNRAKGRLLQVVPIALGVIFVMLFLMFGDVAYASVVFLTVPLALIGGILAITLRGMPFSIPAAIGFIAVSGVSVLNGVVMATQMRLAPAAGTQEGILEGARHALRAIVTTSLVAAIGFVPLAISTHAGAEVQRPLATVVIGGILSSTLLGLAVLPIMFACVGKRVPSLKAK
jgi:cobalt-zinc-cadmium resistance protein CzcA